MIIPVLFFLSIIFNSAQCSKILVVFPFPAFSHYSIGFRIAKELADRGHEVTMINPYPQKTPIKHFRDISVEDNIEFLIDLKNMLFNLDKMSAIEQMKLSHDMGIGVTNKTFANANVQKLINSGEKFDLIIIEHFVDDAYVGFSAIFKAPVIFVASTPSSFMNNHFFANPAPSSYIPNPYGSFTKHTNFWHRLGNLFLNVVGDVMRELYYMPQQRKIFKTYVKTDLELDDVLYNTSLMLTNSHVSVNEALPHVPNVIEIGGFHIKPRKQLPEDIQKFLDDSKEGVVLFSMGSNLKSKDLKPEVRDGILKAFAKIKQKVLWKFETDLPGAPKNVKVMSWLPQQDILAHPNVKAFISHGGLLSTIESVYFGVPIIGIPVFGDQKSNIASAVQNGYAVVVPLPELSEETLSWALNEILKNPKYRENVKWRSSVMNDQPLSPIDAAIYWIEHVIRHKGASHLRSAGLALKWYQRDMLDIIIFLTVITIALFIIFYIIIKKIIHLCVRTNVKSASKAKKNK